MTLGLDIAQNMTSLVTNMSLIGDHNHQNGENRVKLLNTVIKVVYVFGIIGNAAAIVILRRGERRIRNRKHLLLMTSLAANDLVALMGMLTALLVSEHHPSVRETRGYCAARVVLRVFGIGSVCIAVTMAIERYMALTRPFVYQKQVTYYVIRVTLLVSWCWAAILTCAPIVGFGLYYENDGGKGTCTRYRNAKTTADLIYAGLYVAFGALLCVSLVYCNLAVIRALYAISSSAPVVRRVSKSSCRQRQQRSITNCSNGSTPQPQHNAATAEEVAFSRLMATLSVLFMICWLPQIITSSLYLTLGPPWWPRLNLLSNLSDLLMLLNYVLDPFLYVLMRRGSRTGVASLCRAVTRCFKHKKSHKTSTESMKTSCCPQETIIMSENSSGGAEMKPLKPITQVPMASMLKIDD